MMTSRVLARAALAAALVFLVTGCSSKPRPYPVEGVVLLDGEPLDAATLTCFPDGPGEPAAGVTLSDGSFKLDTQAGSGAMAGSYRVTLSKMSGPGLQIGGPPASGPGRDAYLRRNEEIRRQQKQWVPKRYMNVNTTPLRFTVPVKEKLRLELRSSETASPAGDGK